MWPFSRKRPERAPQCNVFVSDGEGWLEARLYKDASGRLWVSSNRHGWLELGDDGFVVEASNTGMANYGVSRKWRHDPVISCAMKSEA